MLGVRVHPAEVEAQLTTHPAVAGAVVVGERLLGRTSLTAYVVPAGATTPAELKRYLREHLPSQFVPSKIKSSTRWNTRPVEKLIGRQRGGAAPDHDSKGADR